MHSPVRRRGPPHHRAYLGQVPASVLQKTTLQFTATPFRNDGKHVDGKIIFNYPLRKAQEEEYFKHINFIPLRVYNYKQADAEIAAAAVRQLEADLDNKLDHLVMARAVNIDRAKEVHESTGSAPRNTTPF